MSLGEGLEGGRLDFIRAPDFIEACWESWERSARLNLNPILSHPENSQKVTGYASIVMGQFEQDLCIKCSKSVDTNGI